MLNVVSINAILPGMTYAKIVASSSIRSLTTGQYYVIPGLTRDLSEEMK